MNQSTENFKQARNKLTTFYVGVLLCIVLVFSIFLYIAQNNDYRRIVVQQDFGGAAPRRLTRFQTRIITTQVRELRTSFFYELIIIDSAILLVGGVLSYFFAGVTLQPINKALSNQKNFLADASHELRTPLAAMQTAIEVVLRREQKSPEIYKNTLLDVQGEVGRMRNLIDELLFLSRYDMDQVTIAVTTVALSEIAKKTVKEITPLALKKNIQINQQIDNEIFVRGDSERIKQVLLILFDNAIKFTPDQGEITLIVGSKPQPFFSVLDTGKGIAQEKQKEIFKRFYQTDKSHTGSGSGLGLAIAYTIMKLHKGALTVKSSPSNGSTFTCFFPNI